MLQVTMLQPMRFETYAAHIQALPGTPSLSKADLLCPAFRLYQDARLEIYYAPFDYLNPRAKVVLVGVTPGWTQMEIAYRQARVGLHAGLALPTMLDRIDEHASFAGAMRRNLVTMLDALALPAHLGVPSSASLFSTYRPLLHTTSAFRYPVFVHGRNCTGHTPKPLRMPALLYDIEHLLAEELQQVPDASIIPLGQSVSTIIEYLAEAGRLDRSRCLLGFPHPSGANGHRGREFNERRERLTRSLKEWFA